MKTQNVKSNLTTVGMLKIKIEDIPKPEIEIVRRRVRHDFSKVITLTEQSHKESCDIRFIVKKAQRTGMVAHLAKHEGRYMDLVNKPDYIESMNVLADAKSTFESVPSKIREKFKNDPAEFLEFMQNPDNREEMLKLGFSDSHLPPVTQPLKTSDKASEKPEEPPHEDKPIKDPAE